MNNVKLLHIKCFFFQFFNSPMALKNLKKFGPPRKSWNDVPVYPGAPIHKFLGGAKFFLAWEKFFFALSCQKLRISTPYWKQFMYWNVIKFDMIVHILNIEFMKQIKKKFGGILGGGDGPPSPPNWRHCVYPCSILARGWDQSNDLTELAPDPGKNSVEL